MLGSHIAGDCMFNSVDIEQGNQLVGSAIENQERKFQGGLGKSSDLTGLLWARLPYLGFDNSLIR